MKKLHLNLDASASVWLGFGEIVEGLVGLALCLSVLLPPLPPAPGFSQRQWQFGVPPMPPVSGAVEALLVGGVALAIYVIVLGARRIAKTPIK